MQHVAGGATAAHLGNDIAGFDLRTLGDQSPAVVRVGGEPLIVVLDDDQLTVADQSGTGVNNDAIGSRNHRLPGAAGDVDALLCLIAGHETANDLS